MTKATKETNKAEIAWALDHAKSLIDDTRHFLEMDDPVAFLDSGTDAIGELELACHFCRKLYERELYEWAKRSSLEVKNARKAALEDDHAKMAAIEAVTEILKTINPIPMDTLGPLSFRVLTNNPNRLNATKLLTTLASEFLPTCDGYFSFDGENVTPAAA